MSGDLLRYLSGPNPYSPWWSPLAGVLLVAVLGWLAGLIVWTLPPRQLRRIPGIRWVHAGVIRRRFAAAISATMAQHRTDDLSTAAAAAVMSRTLRSFLALASDSRAQYVHTRHLAAGELASAAPVLAAFEEARYNPGSLVDLASTAHAAEAVIRSWT